MRATPAFLQVQVLLTLLRLVKLVVGRSCFLCMCKVHVGWSRSGPPEFACAARQVIHLHAAQQLVRALCNDSWQVVLNTSQDHQESLPLVVLQVCHLWLILVTLCASRCHFQVCHGV